MTINKTIACIFFLMIFNSVVFSAEESNEEPLFVLEGGVSIIPYSTWKFLKSDMEYEMDSTRSTSYEANFRFVPLGLSGLLSMTVDDTFIGKVDKILGLIAYKRAVLRMTEITFKGSAHWPGQLTSDMKSDFDFDNKIKHYDLYYSVPIGPPDADGIQFEMNFGIGYTDYSLPVQINSSRYSSKLDEVVAGVPTYDKDFKAKYYCFVFGIDLMTVYIHNQGRGSALGLSPWIAGQDRFGIGKAIVSESSAKTLEVFNPGTHLNNKTKVNSTYLENDSILGIMWIPSFARGKVAIGVGYNLIVHAVATWGDTPNDTTEINWDADYYVLRHGVVFKIYAVW